MNYRARTQNNTCFNRLVAHGLAVALNWDQESHDAYLNDQLRENLVLDRNVKARFKPNTRNPLTTCPLNDKRITWKKVAGERDLFQVWHKNTFALQFRAKHTTRSEVIARLRQYGVRL